VAIVVMRVTTLKASSDRLGGLLAYYTGLAEDRGRDGPRRGPVDYYLDPNEPSGRWHGRGLAALGLGGSVVGDELRALLEGRHPLSGEGLGRRFGERSARGYDATFSAPKSVSVLWAISPDPWVCAEVLAAHDTAVRVALDWFETHGAVTRRGRDGVAQVDTAGVAMAVFRQHTSRAMDPQLHSHAVIAAKVQDPIGRWLSLDARFLKFQQRSIGAIYDAVLRTELTGRLGVAWTERSPGVFDLACVPDRVRDGFSRRSTQADAKLAELIGRWSANHDGQTPDARTIATLERAAVVASRPTKTHAVDGARLRDEWTAEARGLGFDPGLLIADRIREPNRAFGVADQDLIDEVLCHASQDASTWLQADLARHLAAILDPSAQRNGPELVAEIDRLAALATARCVPLGPGHSPTTPQRRDGRPVTEHVTDRHYTTRAVLHEECALQAWAEAHTQPVEPRDDPQAAAIKAIAGHAPLVLLVGPAGTGKTHTTARAVERLSVAGRPVVGLAPSGKAADVLAREARCPTDTLAGFLTRHRHRASSWPAGTTVILDEAAMTATADLVQLTRLVDDHGWRLVAVGDPHQLPSVGRGGVFAQWCDTLACHTLETPRRFTEPWEAAASLALRAGDSEAVDAYGAHGRLHTSHPAVVANQVARAHRDHVAAGWTVAITTANTDTARAINREIQHRARRHGRGAELHDGTTVHVGDQIATRRNDLRLRTTNGEPVRNRYTWTVTALRAGGCLTVAHPDRGAVDLPAAYVAEHVELGWAVTGYGTQGDTVDIGIAVLEPGTSRNHAYVALTRGRAANHAILVDPTGTEDPADQLIQMVNRPAHGESALATQSRLHIAAGREPPAPTDPGTSGGDELQAKIDELTRRLDRIQHRAAGTPEAPIGV
jgi:conjugative relaxase-like TrwC/TraI family protein